MIWGTIGLLLIIIEVFTSTFYFLVISVAFFIVGALEYFFNTSLSVNLILVGSMSIVNLFIVYFYQKNKKLLYKPSSDNSNIGKIVLITDAKDNENITINYRGTQWQAKLKSKEIIDINNIIDKNAKIIEQKSNVFIIEIV